MYLLKDPLLVSHGDRSFSNCSVAAKYKFNSFFIIVGLGQNLGILFRGFVLLLSKKAH
jgi:hypothetical protein